MTWFVFRKEDGIVTLGIRISRLGIPYELDVRDMYDPVQDDVPGFDYRYRARVQDFTYAYVSIGRTRRKNGVDFSSGQVRLILNRWFVSVGTDEYWKILKEIRYPEFKPDPYEHIRNAQWELMNEV